jgi:hypothetical protein
MNTVTNSRQSSGLSSNTTSGTGVGGAGLGSNTNTYGSNTDSYGSGTTSGAG